MKIQVLFLATVSSLLNSIETLSNYFIQALLERGVKDVSCGIFMSKGLHDGNDPNLGRPCFILSKEVSDDKGKFDRTVSIAIDKESCCLTFNFTRDFTEAKEFSSSIKKLAEEEFIEDLADFFIKTNNHFDTDKKRSLFVAKVEETGKY